MLRLFFRRFRLTLRRLRRSRGVERSKDRNYNAR